MPARAKHREPIIDAAIKHFRQNGYPGTGLNDIVETSGAPKGSIYHYFPNGKPSIAVAALEEAANRMAHTMREIASESQTAEMFILQFAKTMGKWMKSSGYKDGCPMTTVLLELAPQDRHVTSAGRSSYTARLAVMVEVLEANGFKSVSAEKVACLWLSSLNGALIQARVERSVRPIDTVADLLARAVDTYRSDER